MNASNPMFVGSGARADADPLDMSVVFRVEVLHPTVLANGRQQGRVRLSIQIRADGSESMPTPEEIDSIRVVRYDDHTELPLEDVDFSDGWSSQSSYRGYDFGDPRATGETDGRHPRPVPLTRAFTAVDRYVSAGGDQVNTTLHLAFSFRGRDGWVYRTNGWLTSPSGDESYQSSYDFPEHTIQAVRPPTYVKEHLRLSTPEAPNPIDNDPVTLELPVPIRHIICEPPGMIRWIHNSGSAPCFTGYASPGDTSYQWISPLPVSSTPLPTPGTALRLATIVVCARNDIPYGASLPKGPLSLDILDTYGTVSRFTVAFDETRRGKLNVQ